MRLKYYFPIIYVISQENILGPSLLLIFINYLWNTQLNNGKIVSFVDDTALFFHANSLQELFLNVQKGFKFGFALARA